MEKILIRKASVEDLSDIIRLNFKLFEKEHEEFDKSLDMRWTRSKKGRNYFRAHISKNDGIIIVAEKNQTTVGYLCGGLHKHSYRIKANYAELENMIVDEKNRGRGVGAKLTKEFFKWCKSRKVKYISVTASAQNKTGIKFYKSLGFSNYNLTLEKII